MRKFIVAFFLSVSLVAMGAPAHADSFFGKPCGGKPSLFVKPLPKCPKHHHNVSFGPQHPQR